MRNITFESEIEEYLSEILAFTQKMDENTGVSDELIRFLDSKIDESELSPEQKNFYIGERNFYSGYYEAALKHYLLSKSIPNFEFYCFRASAFAAKKLGNHDKATIYYEKAKKIYPDDVSLNLLFAKPKEECSTEVSENEGVEESSDYGSSTPISGFFATQKTDEPPSTQTLIERLYPELPEEIIEESIPEPRIVESKTSLSDLKKAAEEVFTLLEESEDISLFDKNEKLETTIREHLAAHENSALEYISLKGKRPTIENHTLFMINGWKAPYSTLLGNDTPVNLMAQLLQNKHPGVASCGFYIRWNNKGIVINPGEGFLKNFHKNGFLISDIDYVIVTRNEPETYADTRLIYHLNYQINKVSAELHIIQYYLNQASYQDLSRILKPNFKQERNAIHSLEIFIDSPEVEKVEITPEITLNYFSIYQRNSTFDVTEMPQVNMNATGVSPSLGIRLDLTVNDMPLVEGSDRTIKLGYITGACWSPLLAHHLGHCDLIVAGFGHTCTSDFSKVDYNERCLGYYGTFSLFEDLNPQVLLSTEFDGREGDIRLDIVKKMRRETRSSPNKSKNPSVIIPADTGLCVNLKELKIRCSITQEWLEPSLVQVVKTANSFGTLKYLSPDSCL